MKHIALFGWIVTLSALALALAGCGDVKEQLNLKKNAPDEFAITTRAPLAMPPSLNDLPTPQPGAPRPQDQSAFDHARASILGEENAQNLKTLEQQAAPSDGEFLLLQKTGAANATPAIRAAVDAESDAIAKEDEPGINKLKRLVGQDTQTPAKLLDPTKELARIRANQAAGKPITNGKTPILGEDD